MCGGAPPGQPSYAGHCTAPSVHRALLQGQRRANGAARGLGSQQHKFPQTQTTSSTNNEQIKAQQQPAPCLNDDARRSLRRAVPQLSCSSPPHNAQAVRPWPTAAPSEAPNPQPAGTHGSCFLCPCHAHASPRRSLSTLKGVIQRARHYTRAVEARMQPPGTSHCRPHSQPRARPTRHRASRPGVKANSRGDHRYAHRQSRICPHAHHDNNTWGYNQEGPAQIVALSDSNW